MLHLKWLPDEEVFSAVKNFQQLAAMRIRFIILSSFCKQSCRYLEDIRAQLETKLNHNEI